MGVQYDFRILKDMVWYSNVIQLEIKEIRK